MKIRDLGIKEIKILLSEYKGDTFRGPPWGVDGASFPEILENHENSTPYIHLTRFSQKLEKIGKNWENLEKIYENFTKISKILQIRENFHYFGK